MINTTIINFYGGPGSGKSTLSGELFGWMKRQRINCEYVQEFAKDLTWKGDTLSLQDQLYISGVQHNRLYTVLGQCDYIITDSPILLGIIYFRFGFSKFDVDMISDLEYHYEEMLVQLYRQYNNINFMVERGDREYLSAGRNQTYSEARQIDYTTEGLLKQYDIPFTRTSSLDDVLKELNIAG